MTKLAGDSSEQRDAEEELLKELSKELGVNLTKKKFSLNGESQIELDGFCKDPLVLCEAWAHIGPPKSAQKNKVMTDALKLIFTNKLFKGKGKCILLFADHGAAAHFQGKSWMAQCLKEYNIEVRIIKLSQELRSKVMEAQKRQYR